MTAAFIALWVMATGLMAFGCWLPALVVAGVAVVFGAWHWIARQARAAMTPREPV